MQEFFFNEEKEKCVRQASVLGGDGRPCGRLPHCHCQWSTPCSLLPMAPKYIGALDQGTTSTRFILFDHSGSIVSVAQAGHRQICPQSGWVEHDPEELWERTVEVIRECLGKVGASPGDISSLGITNQRETMVVWDAATGKAYHNALVWQDQRGAPLCNTLAKGHPQGEDRFRAQTGLPVIPYFTASKLAWCLDNVAGLREEAVAGQARAGTIDSFLVWRLTAAGLNGASTSTTSTSSSSTTSPPLHITDVSNASRTLLFDIHTMAWSKELCDAFRVPMGMLPKVVPSSGELGVCSSTSALPGVRIGGILGDQQAALFGQACFSPGDAKNTYGTGCFLLMNTGTKPVQRPGSKLLTTVAYQIGAQAPVYALEGSVAVAGASVSWMKDNVGLVKSAAELEELAGSVPDNGGAVFVPAFNGLFAPYWRTDARGIIVGLSGNITRAHLARATLEAVAHQSRELLETMDAECGDGVGAGAGAGAGAVGSGETRHALKVDGGMTANNLLMQYQSDITRRKVVRPVVAETTALGAAYAAGLSTGFWGSTKELEEHWKPSKAWSPVMALEARAAANGTWERAVARSLFWHGDAAKADPFPTLLRSINIPRVKVFSSSMLYLAAAGAFCAGAAAAALAFNVMKKKEEEGAVRR